MILALVGVARSLNNVMDVRRREEKLSNKELQNSDNNFYWENGFCVFTEHFLMKRGHCCGNGCRHCPYEPKCEYGNKNINPKVLQKL